MPFHMMDAEDRDFPCKRKTRRHTGSDHQRADQARSCRVGNAANILRIVYPGTPGHIADECGQSPDVVPRRQFGHDATVFAVQVHLAVETMREQTRVAVVQRDRGLITRGFYPESQHAFESSVQALQLYNPGGRLRCFPGPGGLFVSGLVIRFSTLEGVLFMPSVKVRESEHFDAALRRFKRACEKAGILTELRRREFYEKPTQERKRKKAAAVKRHMKRLSREASKRKRLY